MWQDKAACLDAPVDLFWSGVASRVEKAKAICETCRVIDDCLAFAIANEDFEVTIYGGLTGDERREIAKSIYEDAMACS